MVINSHKQPIGIFDSGVGGISVIKALLPVFPNEHFIYFGDTLHMPYGKRTLEEVRFYSRRIIEFFIEKQCKLIVIACNTATASFQDISDFYKDKVKIINVIEPVVDYILKHYAHRKVGLFCTDLTCELGIFEKKIEDEGNDIRLISFKASHLAHLIETEFEDKARLIQLIREYFSHNQLQNVEAMILGCTHYIWLKNHFIELNPFIDWVDPVALIIREIADFLEQGNLAEIKDNAIQLEFYQSGDFKTFIEFAREITPPNLPATFHSNCAEIFMENQDDYE